MRIALLPSAYAPAVGGVEEHTHRLAIQLQALGHAVEVWTHRHPPSLPAAELIDGVQVRRFALPLPAGSPRAATQFFGAAPSAWRALRRAVDDFAPEVLHVECFSVNGIYATALSRVAGVPMVVSLHGETFMDDHDIYAESALLRLGLRTGLARARVVTGCSRYVLDDARRFGLRPAASVVVPNGVVARLDPPIPVPLPFDRFVFGLGRLVQKKGFDLLLRAFADVAAQRPDLGLVIGGDGPAAPELRRLALELGLGQRLYLPGTLSRGQVSWAMHQASAFVMPSRVEAFGIVALEALAAGCPTVVSSRGGAAEVVRDDVDGLVADPTDTGALAAAMGAALGDRMLVARLKVAGPARAAQFSWESVAAQFVDLYRSAVREPAHAGRFRPPRRGTDL